MVPRPFLLAIIPVVLAFPTTSSVHAATIHVPSGQPTIQAGINAAVVADTVLVAPGTYSGPGNRDLDFHGRNIVVRSSAGPSSTTIDCENAGRGFHLHLGETRAAVIQGFSIRNGQSNWPGGAGILCEDASPLVEDCRISQCTAESGGGIQLTRSAARIENCSITSCFAQGFGGGILVDDVLSRVEIAGTSVIQNRAFSFSGGGIWVSGTGAVHITGSNIAANEAGAEFGNGGGVSCEGSSLGIWMSDCAIEANTQTSIGDDGYSLAKGGGVYASGDSVSFIRCGFVRNAVRGINYDVSNEAYGGGAYIRAPYTVLEDCFFGDNEAEAYSTAGQGGYGRARGGGLFCESAVVSNCRFEGNLVMSHGGRFGNTASGGGLQGNDVLLAGSVLLRNGVIAGPPNPYEASGGGAALKGGSRIEHTTLAENWSTTHGSGFDFHGPGTVEIDRSIIAFGGTSEAISCTGVPIAISCSDVFGNAGGDWIGCIASQAGQNGNRTANPLFCNLAAADLTLASNSPCAPPGTCGLIGALPVTCGPIGISDASISPATTYVRLSPNPIAGSTSLQWSTSSGDSPVMRVFDIMGRVVLRRSLPSRTAGTHEMAWTEITQGVSLAAGVYFLMVETPTEAAGPIRMVLMR